MTAEFRSRTHPTLRHGDFTVAYEFMVSAVIQEKNRRRSAFGMARSQNDPVDAGPGTVLLEAHPHQLALGETADGSSTVDNFNTLERKAV